MSGELLASIDDINTHLPSDKAQIDDADDDLLQIDAHRTIRALLAGTFTAVQLATWVDPATTPPLIRQVAGLLIAAKWYATLYAEDSIEDSTFAQSLYNEAIGILNGIRDGTLTVIGADGTTIIDTGGTGLSSDDFFPNDSAAGPVFTMDAEFG